ncbi:MAG: hypothetical protein WAL71_06030 [Terriglobales bacterium]
MKKCCLVVLMLSAVAGMAMPIASSARALVPSEIQQLIGVDYRSLKDSPTAQKLKDQVLPQDLKDFEASLKGVGIDTENDVDQLNFISFRTPKVGIQTVCVAQGSFSAKAVLKKLKLKKISATKYGTTLVYPMSNGYVMTFLDDNTLAFGMEASLHSALDTRDGKRESLDSNPTMANQMSAVDAAPVWSILDQQGTQAMVHSFLGDAAKIADYESVKKRILASRYSMSFQNGIAFDLNVQTSDSMTAGTLSSVAKAGILFKKMNATSAEKAAFDAASVDSDGSNLQMHFKSDDQKFQALMQTPLFAAISH